MAKAEHREGFEFMDSKEGFLGMRGSVWLTLPLYELSSASTEEVKHELLGWQKAEAVYDFVIMCRKAYRQKGKCGWYQGKIAYVKYHIIGHDIKPGESIRMLYKIIGHIDLKKQQKGEIPF